MGKDFEIVNKKENVVADVAKTVATMNPKLQAEVVHAACTNFGEIINLAGKVADIKKIYAESDKEVAKYEEERKNLEAETRSYVDKLQAETNNTISKAEVIRALLNDFYKNNTDDKLSGDQFVTVMTGIISAMGDL